MPTSEANSNGLTKNYYFPNMSIRILYIPPLHSNGIEAKPRHVGDQIAWRQNRKMMAGKLFEESWVKWKKANAWMEFLRII
jgi:hypothetical protein